MNDFGLLVGRFFTSLPTLANEQLSELMLDSAGRLIISGRWLEDSQHASGDAGIFSLGVRDDGTQASATVGPNVFTSVNRGLSGNSISLVFDGVDDVSTVVAAWNGANPNNQVSFTGSGATVPSAQTVNLSGGAEHTVWTSDHGDYSPIAVDKYGRIQVIANVSVEPSDAEFTEDSPNNSGDVGLHVLTVRQDVLATSTSANGDYADFKVNALGELYVHDTDVKAQLVLANASLDAIEASVAAIDIDTSSIITELQSANTSLDAIESDVDQIRIDTTAIRTEIESITFNEDAPHTSGDAGIQPLLVRQDTLAVSTSADGDYGSFKSNNKGELYVIDKDANASLDNIEANTLSISNEISALSYAEDTPHTSGDMGTMPLAVRRDADTSLVDTDGDYAPLQVDSIGRLKVVASATITPNGSEQYTVTDALAAGGDGLVSITASATPWVSVATFSHTSGVAYVYGWEWACDQNADARIVTDDGVDVVVYKRALNSSSSPTWAEHWSDGGRIEITGSAGMEIKLEMKKRSGTGGNALGTGSLHIRK